MKRSLREAPAVSLESRRRELRRCLEAEREALQQAVRDAAVAARRQVSLGEEVAENPALWLSGAALTGLLLAFRQD